MTLEELLSDQGTEPLTNKVNGAPLRAKINASLKRAGVPAIDSTTPSEKILEAIYGLEDEAVRNQLLNTRTTEVKGSLNFKRILAASALVATFGLIIFFTSVVRGNDPLTSEEIDLVKSIGLSAFDLVKELFTSAKTQ